MEELTLVIPAKNEAECLPKVLNELKNFDCKKIIIIPETDLNTQNSAKNFDCKIITQKVDGFGRALILGIKEVETNFLCIFNADGSFDPQYLKNMYNELLNNCDFVFNSRYENNGGSDDDTFLTLVGNRIFTFICNLLFRYFGSMDPSALNMHKKSVSTALIPCVIAVPNPSLPSS